MEATMRLVAVARRVEERKQTATRLHRVLNFVRSGLPGFVLGVGTLVTCIVTAYLVSP